jgi:uncharacterized protein (DUF1330 family)
MAVFVVYQATIQDRAKMDAYRAKFGSAFRGHGGRVLAADANPDVIEGSISGEYTVLLEFESKDAFNAWYNSPGYQEILPVRLEAATGSLILVQGFEG